MRRSTFPGPSNSCSHDSGVTAPTSGTDETWLPSHASVVLSGSIRDKLGDQTEGCTEQLYNTTAYQGGLDARWAGARSKHGGRGERGGRGSGASPGGRDVGAGGTLRRCDYQQRVGCGHPWSSREVSGA